MSRQEVTVVWFEWKWKEEDEYFASAMRRMKTRRGVVRYL